MFQDEKPSEEEEDEAFNDENKHRRKFMLNKSLSFPTKDEEEQEQQHTGKGGNHLEEDKERQDNCSELLFPSATAFGGFSFPWPCELTLNKTFRETH